MGDAGRDRSVGDVGGPSGLSSGKEEKAVGSCTESGYGDGEGVGAGVELGGYHLGGAGDGLIVKFGLYWVNRVFF